MVDLDSYELPRIPKLISQLRDYRWFTTIDLNDGFYHVPIRKENREKTTFSTETRLMQFKRMPQGYKNSPGVFQRVMTIMLESLLDEACLVYIDDILIFGMTEKDHDMNLAKVLSRLEEYQLEENLDKRRYKKEKVVFLGFRISCNTVKPTIARSQGIAEYATPRTKKALQRFLGLLNYDMSFFSRLAEKVSPLFDLLS